MNQHGEQLRFISYYWTLQLIKFMWDYADSV